MGGEKQYDVVVFGATSFVGQILCAYLTQRLAGGDARWAMAGRNADKLAAVAAEVGTDVDRLLADANDRDALDDMCTRSRLVISTVGPYAKYGSDLIGAVVAAGIDYCDLSGEPQWMRQMIDAHQARAAATGARVVHACGFDSVPSDMGVWFLQQHAQAALGEPCSAITMGVRAMRGGPSGGTVASMLNLMEQVADAPHLRTTLTDPFALAAGGDRSRPRQPNVTIPTYDAGLASWLAPFVMAAVNTKIVLRTHSLLGNPWGDDFTYGEAVMTGDGIAGSAKAAAVAGATAGFVGASALSPGRRLIRRFAPDVGEGPSPQQQRAGFFDLRFHGTTGSGRHIKAKVTGDRDPGYGSTAKMLGEAALTLLRRSRSEVGGGFWTPATALGGDYLAALQANAGLTFEIL